MSHSVTISMDINAKATVTGVFRAVRHSCRSVEETCIQV